ncbi:MAG: ribose-phosphate diphosphokinase [bacterium]|nr:ribose-phosphate diphosphokinase [bacterium]
MEKDNLKLVVLPNIEEFGSRVNEHLKIIRNNKFDGYMTSFSLDRFSNSEGKAYKLKDISGKDIYVLTDVGNYGETYKMFGFINHKSYDDHYQDTKRIISALCGQTERLTVIMPLLYASRQHKRRGNESLDCAMALQELQNIGVDRVITFDVHDPTVQSAIPGTHFVNLYPTYSIVKELIAKENLDINNIIAISPDNGAMERAMYYADFLACDVGMFHKRRDFSKIVNGKSPIVEHVYLGREVKGKDALIVDDMIASGSSMLDVAKEMKDRGAKNVYLTTTFALFSDGADSVKKFIKAHDEGLFNKLYTTNLSYIPDYIKNLEWIQIVDCSKYLAKIIDRFNKKEEIEDLTNGSSKEKIMTLIKDRKSTST